MKRALFSLAWLLAAGAPVPAQEVQRHGLVFEQWVRATFFDGYKPTSHTQRWDIPATANRAHGGAPQRKSTLPFPVSSIRAPSPPNRAADE